MGALRRFDCDTGNVRLPVFRKRRSPRYFRDIEGRQLNEFDLTRGTLTNQTPTTGRFSQGRATRDYCIGVLRQAVRDAGLADRTTFVIGADHGFVTVRNEMNLAPVLAEPALDPHIRWRADGWVVAGERLPTFDPALHVPLLDKVLARAAQRRGSTGLFARRISPRLAARSTTTIPTPAATS
jgi:Type I phosphodiesterase / nucleotide pyrophosphatase